MCAIGYRWSLMSLSFLIVLFITIFCNCAGDNVGNQKNNERIIVADSNVNRFGTSIRCDGLHDETQALQHLINSIPRDSVLVIPTNCTVLTGPLTLVSDFTLRVDGTIRALGMGTALLNDKWPKLPPLEVYGNSDDSPFRLRYQALLYASNVTDLRVTGSGTIDGQGEAWWNATTNRDDKNRFLLQAGRPNIIEIVDSKNLEIDSVTLKDSPFWTVHPVLCQNVHIHDTKIRSKMYAHNVDGIDPDSCRNVLIEYNDISTGDDHIAIKAGRCGKKNEANDCANQSSVWNSGIYQSTNITVRYNLMRTGMGIAIGSEMSGSVRNVHIHDNVIGVCESGHENPYRSCGWGPALHIKTTTSRGGFVEDITFEKNTVYNSSMFIFLEMNYQTQDDALPTDYNATVVRNISFVNNRAIGSAKGAIFSCLREDSCHDIRVINNSIDNANNNLSPWSCHFVDSYTVSGNSPTGLEECMYHSFSEKQEKQDTVQATVS